MINIIIINPNAPTCCLLPNISTNTISNRCFWIRKNKIPFLILSDDRLDIFGIRQQKEYSIFTWLALVQSENSNVAGDMTQKTLLCFYLLTVGIFIGLLLFWNIWFNILSIDFERFEFPDVILMQLAQTKFHFVVNRTWTFHQGTEQYYPIEILEHAMSPWSQSALLSTKHHT